MLLALIPPVHHELGPRAMEQALQTLYQQARRQRMQLRFFYAAHEGEVMLLCEVAQPHAPLLRDVLQSAYPQLQIRQLADEVSMRDEDLDDWTVDLRLAPDVLPMQTYRQWEEPLQRTLVDPLAKLTGLLQQEEGSRLAARLECVLEPASEPWIRWRKFVGDLGQGTLRRWTRLQPVTPAEKLGQPLYAARLRISVQSSSRHARGACRRLQQIAAAAASFADLGNGEFRRGPLRCNTQRRPPWFLIGIDEAATLLHPPSVSVQTERLGRTRFTEREPPRGLPSGRRHDEIALGQIAFHSRTDTFGLTDRQRLRHVSITGRTGTGKSTLVERMAARDIARGQGLLVIDPHGDLVASLIRRVPKRRLGETVLFEPADEQFPLAFNPLDCPPGVKPWQVAGGVLDIFKRQWQDVSWGPELESILRASLMVLAQVPGQSMVSLWQMLIDESYRDALLKQVDDDWLRVYWERKIGQWSKKLWQEAVKSSLNKIEQFVSSPILRSILGQPCGKLRMRTAMDEGKIVLANLSKGALTSDTSRLLGALLVAATQQAAMSRDNQPRETRRPFHVFLDEAQNFTSPTLAEMTAELRKFAVSLTLVNQNMHQFDEATYHALMGNVGTFVSFALGPEDSERAAALLAAKVEPEELVALPNFTAFIKTPADSNPFSMRTAVFNTQNPAANVEQAVRRITRRAYATPRKH